MNGLIIPSRGGECACAQKRLRRRDRLDEVQPGVELATFVVETQLNRRKRDDRSGLRHHRVVGVAVVERHRNKVFVGLEGVVLLRLLIDL
jgi:hypothetical protein